MTRLGTIAGLLLCLLNAAAVHAQSISRETPMATADRVNLPGWWPTKGIPKREEYTGPEACTQCHASKAADWKTTPMAHASMPARDAETLRSHDQITLQIGSYHYHITRAEKGSTYSVTDGANTISASLAWAFGIGEVGQTYVYERNGALYESRLSFYTNPQALDFSPGHPRSTPTDLENALGRKIYPSEQRLCFGCHTTASTTSNRFDPSRLIQGVTCEACHGPGVQHVVAMSTGQGRHGDAFILNPLELKPVESVEFCGACHRTGWDVTLAGSQGVFNIRFAPYRLENSKCWGTGDPRLTCIVCHDPHKPLVRDAASYDAHCLACHSSEVHAANKSKPATGPVSTKDCVTCHMPKYEIRGMHAKFTDHRIRIVKEGAPFSD